VPLFYFHLLVGGERSPDDVGVEFDSLEAAYLDAFEAAREMWSELLEQRKDPTERSFEICGADGTILMTLPFTEVLEVARKAAPRSQTINETKNLLKVMRTLTTALQDQIEHTRIVIEVAQQTLHRSSLQRRIF
jgi:hypothetical protein